MPFKKKKKEMFGFKFDKHVQCHEVLFAYGLKIKNCKKICMKVIVTNFFMSHLVKVYTLI